MGWDGMGGMGSADGKQGGYRDILCLYLGKWKSNYQAGQGESTTTKLHSDPKCFAYYFDCDGDHLSLICPCSIYPSSSLSSSILTSSGAGLLKS